MTLLIHKLKPVRFLDLTGNCNHLGRFAFEGLNRIAAFGDEIRSKELPFWIPARVNCPENWDEIQRDYWRHVSYIRDEWFFMTIYAEAEFSFKGKNYRLQTTGQNRIPSDSNLIVPERQQVDQLAKQIQIFISKL